MTPKPFADDAQYRPSGKLRDRVALITGGDRVGLVVPWRYYMLKKEPMWRSLTWTTEDGERCPPYN